MPTIDTMENKVLLKLKIIAFSVLFFFSAWLVAEEQQCPFPGKYIEIDRAYHQCTNGQVKEGASCEFFINNITTLFPKYNCMRSFDNEPVPAIWLFDAASEDYIQLIYEMASRSNPIFNDQSFKNEVAQAKEIFLSQQFKQILDGHLAEKYYPLIETLESTP